MDKRIPWVKSPCRGCGERSAECHADCEAYRKYAEFRKLRRLGYTEFVEATKPTHHKKMMMDSKVGKGKK